MGEGVGVGSHDPAARREAELQEDGEGELHRKDDLGDDETPEGVADEKDDDERRAGRNQ